MASGGASPAAGSCPHGTFRLELTKFKGSRKIQEGYVGKFVAGPVLKYLFEEDNIIKDPLENQFMCLPFAHKSTRR